ncbi:hypothetical protein LNP25_22580 [Klebsiella variicola subsp. variicola]|nr:hypothetical protein [Klebsiella variicola subsp. variicola]
MLERLNDTFRQIELELQTLQQALSSCRLLAAGYLNCRRSVRMPRTIRWPTYTVVQHSGKAALALALRHFSHLFIQQQSENRSSKAAVRLPGYLPAGHRCGAAGSAGAHSAY